ncbi:hypothetical protein ACCS68_04255 [Rhizobium beringeri]|uniref:hypothetical protein n=1 Tax=Rhizobium beringeri TaxID=3019934 RepID=UPI003CF58F73
MNTALNELLDDEEDFRAHVAFHRAQNLRPPYADNLRITTISTFGDPEWIYERHLIAAGHRERNVIKFELPRKIPGGGKYAINPVSNAALMKQLKETLYALIYYRHLLNARTHALKPLSIKKRADALCLLFVNFAYMGFTSIDEIDQQKISNVFSNLPVGYSSYEFLAGLISDINTLDKRGLLSAGFATDDLYIKPLEIAGDTTKSKGALTLSEEEAAFLLSASKVYISKHREIAEQLELCYSSKISRSKLAHWAFIHLPIEAELEPAHVATQLAWLVKIAGYNLFTYHLGSRASESLSIDGDSVTSELSEDGTLRTYLTLTIFKNSNTGERRRYLVHPYLRQVAEALIKINETLGLPRSGLLFRRDDANQEISTSKLNSKIIQFARFHSVECDMTSHSWRYTLSDVVAGSVQNPFLALQYQLDHEYLAESIGYGFHGPSGDDCRNAAIDSGLNSIDSFLEDCFESLEIGGKQGLKIAASLENGASKSDLRRELNDLSITPLKIGKDRYCVKPVHARGKCSFATKDTNPEIEHCRADCMYQTQLSSHKADWCSFIDAAPAFFKDNRISHFEKIRKVDELRQNIAAWPELQQRLYRLMKKEPSLKIWFS